eukprot:1160714-Pelagomonas_calceolata.AAC.30
MQPGIMADQVLVEHAYTAYKLGPSLKELTHSASAKHFLLSSSFHHSSFQLSHASCSASIATSDRGRFSYMGGKGGPLWKHITYQLPPLSSTPTPPPSAAASAMNGSVTTPIPARPTHPHQGHPSGLNVQAADAQSQAAGPHASSACSNGTLPANGGFAPARTQCAPSSNSGGSGISGSCVPGEKRTQVFKFARIGREPRRWIDRPGTCALQHTEKALKSAHLEPRCVQRRRKRTHLYAGMPQSKISAGFGGADRQGLALLPKMGLALHLADSGKPDPQGCAEAGTAPEAVHTQTHVILSGVLRQAQLLRQCTPRRM